MERLLKNLAALRRWTSLNATRRSNLADYVLNISVASFAVAAFGGQWMGILPALLGLCLFLFSQWRIEHGYMANHHGSFACAWCSCRFR